MDILVTSAEFCCSTVEFILLLIARCKSVVKPWHGMKIDSGSINIVCDQEARNRCGESDIEEKTRYLIV